MKFGQRLFIYLTWPPFINAV